MPERLAHQNQFTLRLDEGTPTKGNLRFAEQSV